MTMITLQGVWITLDSRGECWTAAFVSRADRLGAGPDTRIFPEAASGSQEAGKATQTTGKLWAILESAATAVLPHRPPDRLQHEYEGR